MVKKIILFTLSLCLFFGGLYGQTDTVPKVRKSDLKKLTEKYNTLSSEFDKLKCSKPAVAPKNPCKRSNNYGSF
ncbi:hypothetical protein ES705_21833 [subsurface metagenome]